MLQQFPMIEPKQITDIIIPKDIAITMASGTVS